MAKGGSPRLTACVELCALLGGGAESLSRLGFPDGFGLLRRENGAPGKAQRSGFVGERRSSGMSEFSPFWAEMRDMELVTTRSRRKP